MAQLPEWAEWKYALYLGEGGWGNDDTLILVRADGFVKRVANACRNGYFQNKEGEISTSHWDSLPGETAFDIPELIIEDIAKCPQHIIGMDGIEITAYDLRNNVIKKLWKEEDYGQIEPLRVIGKYFYSLFMKTSIERNNEKSMK